MVELSGESLQPLLTWRPGDPGPRPGFGGRGEDLRYMQGTVVRWNPETAENIVRIRGTDHTNVPLIGGLDGLVYQPGDQVAIMAWSPNGGTAAYFIMGRLVVPGTAAAQRAVQALQTGLAETVLSTLVTDLLDSPDGRELVRAIIGGAIHAAQGAGIVTVSTEDTWVSGGGTGTPPQISGVEVGDTGRCLVMLASECEPSPEDGQTGRAYMGFEVSGASSVPPDLGRAAGVGRRAVASGDTVVPAGRVGASVFLDNLSSGTHTFAARFYHSSSGSGSGNTASFLSMTLVVIPF